MAFDLRDEFAALVRRRGQHNGFDCFRLDFIGDFDDPPLPSSFGFEDDAFRIAGRNIGKIGLLAYFDARGRWRRWRRLAASQRQLRRFAADRGRGFQRVEADIEQRLGQLACGLAETVGDDVGVGLVHRILPAACRVGHAQHAAQQLLDVLVAVHLRHRTEHIGEGAVPAFLQCLLGDDDFDGAIPGEQVDTVDLALVAGGDGDALSSTPSISIKCLFTSSTVAAPARAFGLYQQDRPNVVGSSSAAFASDLRRAAALLTAECQSSLCSFSTTGNLIMFSAFSSKAETLTSTLGWKHRASRSIPPPRAGRGARRRRRTAAWSRCAPRP